MKLLESQYQECWEIFLNLGEEGLRMNHYQLAEATRIPNALRWREFLLDPRTADYIASEMNIIRSAAINQMVQKAPDSRSVGQSQLINALQKIDEQAQHKDGPVFIYSYVPLSTEQKAAPNARSLEDSGFEEITEGVYRFVEKEPDTDKR